MKLKEEIPPHMNIRHIRHTAFLLRLRYCPGMWLTQAIVKALYRGEGCWGATRSKGGDVGAKLKEPMVSGIEL